METSNKMQAEEILNILQSTDLFRVLDHGALQILASYGQWVELKPNETLFSVGETADAVYVATKGQLDVIIAIEGKGSPEKIIGEIRPFEVVGEIQLLTMGRRTATIRATQHSRLLKLPRTAFDQRLVATPEFIQSISNIIRKRLFVDRLAEILPRLFGAISNANIKAIIEKAEWVRLERGQILFKKGDSGDSFYILIQGKMLAEFNEGKESQKGQTHQLKGAPISRGESIGELAILTEDCRSATVHALRDSDLVKFSRTTFFNLLTQYPKLLMQITRMIIGRLKTTGSRTDPGRDSSVLAVVPADPDQDLDLFLSPLTHALSSIGTMVCIDKESLERSMGSPGISQIPRDDPNDIRLSSWLSLQEEQHRFVVLKTDPDDSHWTRRCLQQADQVVIVANAESDPRLCPVETELMGRERPMTGLAQVLVLLHPHGKTLPKNTKAWLDKRSVAMHHHVRMDRKTDIERVARFLTGTAVGLALSGGGARGFAHVGAIKAIQEAALPIDMICGTSMGAIIAAQHAIEWDFDTMVENNARGIKNMIFDFTLPLVSIFSGKALIKELKRFLGDRRIEDLWMPYFCVSSNLTRAEVTLHQKGLLWRSVQASNAAPGILPPVLQGKDLLVDGAFLSNLPADALRSVIKGKIIALDVSPPVDLVGNYLYNETVSGWRVFWQKLNPFARQMTIPTILTILRRSGELASVASQKRIINEVADLYFQIPVEQYGLQDYKAVREIIDIGYQYIKHQLGSNPVLP
jgi:predicted acylesterase/phospholipase RssA/CRP-like cAMP-binding protein